MIKLGIIGAMTVEVETLKENMCDLTVSSRAGMTRRTRHSLLSRRERRRVPTMANLSASRSPRQRI